MQNNEPIIARIKKIGGQLQGLQKMAAADQPAELIINQVKSVEAAIWHLGVHIIDTHKDHITSDSTYFLDCIDILLTSLSCETISQEYMD